jgi:CO/xanthine dehydrogenase Mo-binding subunit
MPATIQVEHFVGAPVLRLEDPTLLRGRARFVDDLPIKAGTVHAAIVRLPHAHTLSPRCANSSRVQRGPLTGGGTCGSII